MRGAYRLRLPGHGAAGWTGRRIHHAEDAADTGVPKPSGSVVNPGMSGGGDDVRLRGLRRPLRAVPESLADARRQLRPPGSRREVPPHH
ncbi:hypothetical protein Stube_30760 [Streptomyces tubercidicus]|uniref:Uncharacterized protein n=1 Tax=Streptomyces tubercidicus TaxID=47759 RepID=A0A640UQU0_9ACTN|nr:hypothetical protein Stube_30760 [Streptomyces tubercidicus]